MLIGGFQKSSLLDYPGQISAIVFTQGCNFRCPYCHNPELINFSKDSSVDESFVLDFLRTRIGKLDAVVITGGEPCLQKDLADFIKKIKEINFLVKLDTNGSKPEVLEQLLNENLIDYVAMDIKAPIEKYSEIVGVQVDIENILTSIELLKTSKIGYEFRTTVVKSQLCVDDFEKIGKMISGAKAYYLQRFVPSKILDTSFMNKKSYSDEEFVEIVSSLKLKVKSVAVR